MFNVNVDLGQLIITGGVGLIGWLIKRELNNIVKKLDEHDMSIIRLVSDVQRLIGAEEERRAFKRRNIDRIE